MLVMVILYCCLRFCLNISDKVMVYVILLANTAVNVGDGDTVLLSSVLLVLTVLGILSLVDRRNIKFSTVNKLSV